MKEIPLHELRPGVRLAKPITGRSGVIMLESGTELTPQYIERLKNMGIRSVFVQNHEERRVSPDTAQPRYKWTLLSNEERETMKNNDAARQAACHRLMQISDSESELQNMALPFRVEKNRRQIREILREIASQRQLADELGILLQTDRFLFEHSLRVGLLAGVIGLAKKFDAVRLFDLVLGGLLFDIGMTAIPNELLCKKGRLSKNEQALIRQHTTEGYRILTSVNGVSLSSAKCALLHHERYRGEGYPFGLKSDDLPEFAQIVGLVDVYDALMSHRHHRHAFTPGEAVEYLFAAGNYDFDMSLIWVFLRNIYIFPVSSVIQLSNGQIGIVSESENTLNHRPVVRIIREADGTPVTRPYEVNLLHYRNLTITDAFARTAYDEACTSDGK